MQQLIHLALKMQCLFLKQKLNIYYKHTYVNSNTDDCVEMMNNLY